jgi:hypothetical protein
MVPTHNYRHARESGHPGGGQALRMWPWTPAFAEATEKEGWVPYVWFIPLVAGTTVPELEAAL